MSNRLGFMQGRLSPLIDGRVQAFPWLCWKAEFPLAQDCGFRLIEWTLDQERLYENPLLTIAGQVEIKALCRRHDIRIPSLTGDCFMQAPFWKTYGEENEMRKQDFRAIIEACAVVGISIIVVPLVDNGRLETAEQENDLVDFFRTESRCIAQRGLRVVFESDHSPLEMACFIERFDPALFGINYDIGNSAALGFDPCEEVETYGKRIYNIHIKDRMLGGATVPLGSGHAKFEAVFIALTKLGYRGNYILQTARAADNNHIGALCRYRDMATQWLTQYAA